MSTKGHQMGRREFLVVSSTCALATVAVGPQLLAGSSEAAPRSLAVGYAALDQTGVAAATAVPAGDGGFIGRDARITVSGASGTFPVPRAHRAVDLLVYYSYLDGATRRSTPFRAWSCSRSTGCQGNQVSFNVPVDELQKLVLTVGTERGLPAGIGASRREAMLGGTTEAGLVPVALSLTSERDTLKLVRGYYVIVPLFEDEQAPAWSAFTLGRHEGRMALVDRDGNVAPFEHFVLKVDYARKD